MRNIVLTLLIVLAAIFTLQNMHSVDLTFIIWSTKTVVAFAIILALVLGMIIGALLALPAVMRSKRATKQSKQHAAELENTLMRHKSNTVPEDSRSEMPRF